MSNVQISKAKAKIIDFNPLRVNVPLMKKADTSPDKSIFQK